MRTWYSVPTLRPAATASSGPHVAQYDGFSPNPALPRRYSWTLLIHYRLYVNDGVSIDIGFIDVSSTPPAPPRNTREAHKPRRQNHKKKKKKNRVRFTWRNALEWYDILKLKSLSPQKNKIKPKDVIAFNVLISILKYQLIFYAKTASKSVIVL